jgi:uroporphyrin-III C-methyltransferase
MTNRGLSVARGLRLMAERTLGIPGRTASARGDDRGVRRRRSRRRREEEEEAKNQERSHIKMGTVSLVGAGPGDPGLLTLAALDRLREAHVVIYDRLVSREVLDMVPPSAIVIYGGKDPESRGRMRQEALNKVMLDEAKLGRKVVRLKGGDPFLFSRGGEEAEFLRDHGVDFEVIPGVSSALAAPTYAGIPLTDRRYSSSVTIVTGREADVKERMRKGKRKLDWSKIAGGSDAIVVLMGAGRLREIATRLVRAGEPRDTPLAAITWGTTDRQSTTTMTLGEAAEGVRSVAAPCVIVIGRVVALARKLRWLRDRDGGTSPATSGRRAQGGERRMRRGGDETHISARAAAREFPGNRSGSRTPRPHPQRRT